MKPKDIINALANTNSEKGKLWFTKPMTNIPLGKNDIYAAKILEKMDEILPSKFTAQDYINVLAEVQWWIITFSFLKNDESFAEKEND